LSNKKPKRKTRNKRKPKTSTRKISKHRSSRSKNKMSDHKATCLKCAELTCEIRPTCFDDITATEPRKENLEEIPTPMN
jgi:hypothetical protein